jgi:hypothetical protein
LVDRRLASSDKRPPIVLGIFLWVILFVVGRIGLDIPYEKVVVSPIFYEVYIIKRIHF